MFRSLLLSAALTCLGVSTSVKNNPSKCLPDGINRTDVVSTEVVGSLKGRPQYRKITVEQKLNELKARCRRDKLVDASGTEIRFYKLAGCWGHPSPDDQEVLERQNRELKALRERYRVIAMTCNPSGEQIP
ncbi:MAG: hypothetical protein AABM67_19310 [Acidobacteriota bacterium]